MSPKRKINQEHESIGSVVSKGPGKESVSPESPKGMTVDTNEGASAKGRTRVKNYAPKASVIDPFLPAADAKWTTGDVKTSSGSKGDILELNGFKAEIIRDTDVESPRTSMDNVGTMACFMKRSNLGDKKHGYNSEDYGSLAEIKDAILTDNPDAVVLPLYVYMHSGTTMSTKPFDCKWDSGQAGFIFASGEKIKAEWGDPKDPAARALAEECLLGEVQTYDDWLQGEVFGYKLKGPQGDDLDSCWGFYGEDYIKDEVSGILVTYANDDGPSPRQVIKEKVEEMVSWLDNIGVEPGDLDDLVHDTSDRGSAREANQAAEGKADSIHDDWSHRASDINNLGLAGQVGFMVQQFGVDEAMKVLKGDDLIAEKIEAARKKSNHERNVESANKNVTLNPDYSLGKLGKGVYVLKESGGYSTLGFDHVQDLSLKYAQWLITPAPTAEKGTLDAYVAYRDLADKVSEKCQREHVRCPVQLTPQLIGLEGKRVEVVTSWGETERFWVGKSTGDIPIHLQVANTRSSGGDAVVGAPFKSVRVIRESR